MNTFALMTVRQFEELTINAWPSLQTCCYDGWILRFAKGYTRRANSVYPLYDSTIDLNQKIQHCEWMYERFGQSAIFKMASAEAYTELDRTLEAHGYVESAPSKVLLLDDLSAVPAPEFPDAELLSAVMPPWTEDFVTLSGTDRANIPTMTAMLSCVPLNKAFATLRDGSIPIAMGMAVVEQDYVCFNDIVVAKEQRGKGLGTQLMRHLIAWARENGARHGYLQVLRDNEPAHRLYCGLGFREAYDYWYRVRQTTTDMQSAF
jgi:GNAT superfamily N-acetyltransferase